MSRPYDAAPDERVTDTVTAGLDAPDDSQTAALRSQRDVPDGPRPEDRAADELASGPDEESGTLPGTADGPDHAQDIIPAQPIGTAHEQRAVVREHPQSDRHVAGDRVGSLAAENEVTAPSSGEVAHLPVFDMGIDTHNPNAGRRTEFWGSVESHRLTVSDGTKYEAHYFKPDRTPEGVVPVTFTTPWGTDLAGYNDHVGSLFAKEGMPTIVVSPEQRDVVRAVRNIGKASLAHDAEVQHLILDTLSEAEDDDLSTVINVGSSRGAMVGFGLQAYADQHGRTMSYNDYTDPVLAHHLNLREVPWLRVAPQVARELGALAHTAIPSDGRSLRNLVPTFPLRPGFWVSQASTGLTCLGGEAGSFVPHLPKGTNTHVTFFKDSHFNNAQDWKERLSGFPNVTIVEQPGTHLTFTDMHVIEGTVARVKAAQAAKR